MKNFLFLAIACFSSVIMHSQNIPDALRYAQENLNGSARFSAMSGAFGAVGGDLSAININPAGSSVFANSQVGVTLSNFNTSTKSAYFGSKTSDSNVAFDLNQAGAVFIFNSHSENSGWKKSAVSINYDDTNKFDNSLYTAGTNRYNSIGNYFQSYANQSGLSANDYSSADFGSLNLRERQGFLGYNAYVIDPFGGNANNTSFVSNVPSGGNYYQDNFTESTGYNGKLSFNASSAYKDRIYIGLNINTYFVDYTQSTSFYEENSNGQNANQTAPSIRSVQFDNDLHTYGNGFSIQLGAIAKVTQSFRVGLAYQSPTWYQLNDELRQIVYSDGLNVNNPNGTNTDFAILYDPYNLKTPGKYTGSLAYVFGKHGLLSVDYSLKDYGNTRFRPNDSYFDPINSSMSSLLQIASEIRAGGELRLQKWSLRAGFRYDESPYKNGTTIGDLTSFSGGFGYQFPRTRLDLSYTHAQRNSQQSFFSQGFTDAPTLNTKQNNLSLGLVFEL